MATAGLIFITFLAAIQYIFLTNVPDSVSTFCFVCITNVIGLVVMCTARFKKIRRIRKSTILKGAFFAVLLTGFNIFVLLGSRSMDSVVVSSVVSLYFVFVTPLLLLLRKKVNFLSSIATAMAVIALLLMFGGNTEALFSSTKVIYLVVADLFFAAYVVGVSILGANEDSAALTISQMLFSVLFALVAWVVEAAAGKTTMSLPTEKLFWISVIFMGIFIRAVYGLLQITCQKRVSAISASLIFSTEIVITMIMNPIMSRILGTTYNPATPYQVTGAVLLIIANLLVDETITSKLGYDGMDSPSVSKKMVMNTLVFSMATLALSAIISFSAIYLIRDSAVSGSTRLGEDASDISTTAMIEELERNTSRQVEDKAKLAEQKLAAYSDAVQYAASYANTLYAAPDDYPARPVDIPRAENEGVWTMQMLLANKLIQYEDIKPDNELLGNMENVFEPIVRKHENIVTIYLGTADGLMISYDRDSQLAAGEENRYYEYRKSDNWYNLGMTSGECRFTDTYWDSYGRGLTITCCAPFYGADGSFIGVIGMDILMKDLNESMVNDGIVDPTVATMIDEKGNVIASKDLDPDAQETYNIFSTESESILKPIGQLIIEQEDGIMKTGEDERAVYVSYATIDSTGWRLCIISPVSNVIVPANEIRESIDSNTDSVVSSVLMGVLRVIQNCLVLIGVILLLITFTAGRFSKKISDPLKQLERDVRNISDGDLDYRTQVSTDDEIGTLAQSFNEMTDSLQHYISDLKEVTAKEERIASELSVATNIQASMLPRNFDEINASHREFDLYATMDPAKEVGGDFYDFFLVDDDHLALVIADVSGKGVPAALFMMISKMLIRNRAEMGGTPAEVLSYANDKLCEGNELEYFVTVWMAIIELSTGKGIAANAGHEHPAIRRANGEWELVKYRHSPAVATMEGLTFKEHEFELDPGDSLYVYTDGVPEATDAGNGQFDTDRMLSALNKDPKASPEALLAAVKADIDEFVGDAEQFDDITMLAIDWHGADHDR